MAEIYEGLTTKGECAIRIGAEFCLFSVLSVIVIFPQTMRMRSASSYILNIQRLQKFIPNRYACFYNVGQERDLTMPLGASAHKGLGQTCNARVGSHTATGLPPFSRCEGKTKIKLC